jgi:hypothetical protein
MRSARMGLNRERSRRPGPVRFAYSLDHEVAGHLSHVSVGHLEQDPSVQGKGERAWPCRQSR